jgi:hypothetical protein
MRTKKIVKTTTNRGEFNRAYKAHLERTGKIHCAICKYHHNENNGEKKYYGGYTLKNVKLKMTYPNWKLVSKNKKQWTKKNIYIITNKMRYNNGNYYKIEF